MNIAQINEKYALVGGSEKTMRRCAEGLREAGQNVLIIHGDAEAAGEEGAALNRWLKENEVAILKFGPVREIGVPETDRGALRAMGYIK